jgi:hypothetical protein
MKSPLKAKIRSMAIGALTAAALSAPAVTAVSIAAHDAGRAPVVKPSSHRLALNITPNSVRLT